MLTIYKSSAGSGKTFTLVLEYLKIVLDQPQVYRSVLAVTFTNKATEEMKGRIIEALSKLATLPRDKLAQEVIFQKLQTHFADQPELSIPHRARQVLNRILNDYSNFSINTIESFFQRIVRAFARELNIPLGYDVEMKQDVVLNRIVAQSLLEIGANPGLTELFQAFAERNLDEDRGWNLDREVEALGSQIFKEKFQQLANLYPEPQSQDRLATIQALAKELRVIRHQFEGEMLRLSQEAERVAQRYQLSLEDFAYGRSGVAGYLLAKIREARQSKDYLLTKRAEQALEDPSKWVSARSPRRTDIEAAVSVAGGLADLLNSVAHLVKNGLARYVSARQTLNKIYAFGVISDLQQKLAEYRRENQQLIISDTSFLLHQIILDQEESPFIYEKVGNRFAHFLLDEFQDTSDMQWRNLMPLILDSLAQGQKSLLVGDVKQSIYRWRNGNMRLLQSEVENEILRRRQLVELKALDQNFRTALEIVDFNNRFFAAAAELLADQFEVEAGAEIRQAYDQVFQTPTKSDVPGLVSVESFADLRKEGGPDWKSLAMDRTVNLIRSLKAKEGFLGKEITLLVRKNSEGIALAQYLQAHEIPVISAESLLIMSDPRVRLLHALLQHLNHEQDSVIQATLQFCLADVMDRQAAQHDTFRQSTQEQLPAEFLAARAALRRLAVYECVSQLLPIFPNLLEPNAYLQGFLDAVLEYSSQEEGSIAGFLEWWEEIRHKRAIAGAPDTAAVQIMTIHKAKGLEFPVVILPFAEWDMEPSMREILWIENPKIAPYTQLPYLPLPISSQLEHSHFQEAYQKERRLAYLDNLNLLYVSFTRPQYRLYIFTRKFSGKSISFKLIHHLIHQIVLQDRPVDSEGSMQLGKAVDRAALRDFEKQEEAELASSRTLQRNTDTLQAWNEALRIRYSSNRYLQQSILARKEKIAAGELVHDALAYIYTQADLESAVQAMSLKGYLPAGGEAVLREQLQRAITWPEVADWFQGNWEVRNEAEILSADGNVFRPDRVMIRDQKAIVVDYKSGSPAASHARQLLRYKAALEVMGYGPVDAYVYYLSLGKVEKITQEGESDTPGQLDLFA